MLLSTAILYLKGILRPSSIPVRFLESLSNHGWLSWFKHNKFEAFIKQQESKLPTYLDFDETESVKSVLDDEQIKIYTSKWT